VKALPAQTSSTDRRLEAIAPLPEAPVNMYVVGAFQLRLKVKLSKLLGDLGFHPHSVLTRLKHVLRFSM
jgi:hypothetical protein